MSGVIVVDAGRSRSTNLGCDAYILIISLDIVIIIWSSINCPTVVCLLAVCYFLREATSEIYDTRVYSLSYMLYDLLFATFIFRCIIPKTQKYLAAIFCYLFYFAFYRDLFNQSITNFIPSTCNFCRRYPKRDWQPLISVGLQVFFSLCAGTIYIVLLASPTGSIPWFHNWGKYLP